MKDIKIFPSVRKRSFSMIQEVQYSSFGIILTKPPPVKENGDFFLIPSAIRHLPDFNSLIYLTAQGFLSCSPRINHNIISLVYKSLGKTYDKNVLYLAQDEISTDI